MDQLNDLDPTWAAPLVGAALVVIPALWRHARHAVTLVHELGHASVALLTGRRLTGIRLHRDTSGLTVSHGKPRGPGMVATAAAGHLAPSGLGLLLVAVVAAGVTPEALWAATGILVVTFVFVRNVFGALVLLLAVAAVGAAAWRAEPSVQDAVALGAAWFYLLAGPRTVLELWTHRRRHRTGTTDADVLARLTHLPAAVWNLLLLAAGAAALWPAARVIG